MIETILSLDLFIDEKLEIKKNRLMPEHKSSSLSRLCLVTGIHGDELEGQFVCYEVIQRIQRHPDYLNGIVDIYPCINPLGMDSLTRGMPNFDLDMNRIFPGSMDGAMAERVAATLIKDIEGASMCVDIHASDVFLHELPQVRLNESFSTRLLPYAQMLNTDLIWIDTSDDKHLATLAHSLNKKAIPTLMTEMGVGNRINRSYGKQLVKGIFNLMKHLGIWTGPIEQTTNPSVVRDEDFTLVHSDVSGIFLPSVQLADQIQQGDLIGKVIDPLNGIVKERLIAPSSGKIITLRDYPVVYEGSLMTRIIGGKTHE